MQKKVPAYHRLTGWTLLVALLLGALGGAGLSARAAPRAASALDIVISEVAWMGTESDYRDEWIELYNQTSSDIDLTG
ncbi:MAG: hypothetical protein QGD96_04870, partial [Anaerolineae bacterium]|nr:hypothetical protein [Anaerolineae bacterium]